MALTDIIIYSLANIVDRFGIPRALKTMRDEVETRLAYLEALSADVKPSVTGCPTSALAAYTRVGNVITADAVGALGAQDGVTYIAGNSMLLNVGAAGADNGLYDITNPGAAGAAYVLTRRADSDTSAEMTSGHLVYVSEGTLNGKELFFCDTAGLIVLNTTALSYTAVPSYQDLAGVTATTGGELVGLYDPNGIITATTCGAAIREIAGEMNTHRPGVPMINRLIMLGAPGAIVAGDTVTIGGDIYEFNANTPPAGGTAGSIWVYQGANSAASRANFINAVNNVTDAPNITYDGAVTESMIAVAGTLLGTVDVRSADAIGGALAPSGTATACSEVLTTITDLWDQATMYAGFAQGATQLQMCAPITITADHILQGTLEIEFDFTPVACLLVNRMRPQTEAYTITADRVVLTLGGGGAPANQAADVIDVIVQG